MISGRNRQKLDALASETKVEVAVKEATLDDPPRSARCSPIARSWSTAPARSSATASPFWRRRSRPRTHYLDTTGEQPYMKLAFERYGPAPRDAEVAVIPAMGFDYVPGDMIASLTAEGMGELDEVTFELLLAGLRAQPGNRPDHPRDRSATPAIEWRDGIWQTARGGVSRGTYEFPAPVGRRGMIRYPAGEQITVPRHIPTRNVRTAINASAFASEKLAPLFAVMMRPTGLAMRTPLKRVAQAAVSRLPEGPNAQQRDRMLSTIVCLAKQGETERLGVVSCRDVYGLTAAAISQGAMIAAGRSFEARGALAPSQAFDPKDFLAGLERFDVRWSVEGADSPLPVEA